MSDEALETKLKYFGISPWEIEVAYGYFSSRFKVSQEAIEDETREKEFPDFVSILDIDIPVSFTEEFFQWFEFRRWEKVKALFKEMKRRRGSGHALKIDINFAGEPNIKFVLDAHDRDWYNNAVEKIDFVLELLPYHLAPEKLPKDTSSVVYRYDENAKRWRLNEVFVGLQKFIFAQNSWKKTI